MDRRRPAGMRQTFEVKRWPARRRRSINASMIRDAEPRDYAAIRAVLRHAFPGDDEANLVEQLRADGDVLVELVAASDIAIHGHILYSPLTIERDGASLKAAALAPVSVLPAFQRGGIGGDLIRAGT